MVEELLDFSRLQNGIKMNCEVLDFVAEATDAALFVEARIRQEGMQLVYSERPSRTRSGLIPRGCGRCL